MTSMHLGDDRVGLHMTKSPHTIGKDQTLARAHESMRKHDLRHLPVLEAGRLVGMVSQRDLYFVETLRDVDPERITVEEAMSVDVYAVDESEPLRRVVERMAAERVGSVVVLTAGKVAGIFTVTDALTVLARVLA